MSDTIAAISTAEQRSGISIVRLSGKDALKIADKVFRGKKRVEDTKSHRILYGKVYQGQQVIDECLLSVMREPNSYTRENVVEINVHGGRISARKTLDALIKAGARPAKSGEFTMRAFMNGRIDLSEAEAVSDIIDAKTEMAQTSAVNQLEGKLKNGINEIRDKLIEILSYITVATDFPDEDADSLSGISVLSEITELNKKTEEIIKGARRGIILREGAVCAICGKPNVGKSSLLNALSGEEKAIVTDIEGTTRDIIEEYINVNGVPVKLADTAGIRDDAGDIEKIGVKKALDFIKKADLCIFVADNSKAFDKNDGEILELIKERPFIFVVNKSDKESVFEVPDGFEEVLYISVKEKTGLLELENKIYEKIMGVDFSQNEVMITNRRQMDSCIAAQREIKNALEEMKNQISEDLIAIYLEKAVAFLGEITGMTISEEIIDQVFSKFCIGK